MARVEGPKAISLKYQRWLASHKPFHWFVDFHGIMRDGGFDVIIGNPPYVEYSKVKGDYTIRGYQTESCGNLYAFVMERSIGLVRNKGRCGLIVPIASVSTDSMRQLQGIYSQIPQWHSHYAVRPGKLFVGVDMNLTITMLHKTASSGSVFVTSYRRWSSGKQTDRPYIFTATEYTANPQDSRHVNLFPKLGSEVEIHILNRMLANGAKLRYYVVPTGKTLYYHSGGRYWRKALPDQLSSHYKPITVPSELASVVFALLNSQLFYWYWISNSNCMDVVSREVLDLPVFSLNTARAEEFAPLIEQLLQSYYSSSTLRQRRGDQINVEEVNFDVQKSKPIIDEIDRVLAQHYGFTDEELDFIINYDIKYRMGRG